MEYTGNEQHFRKEVRKLYKTARKRAGLTIEEAAFRCYISARTLCKYESGENMPPPEVVLAMSRAYGIPWMTQMYCRNSCAIGEAYSYEVLTGVNLDPASVMLKLVGELKEAQGVLNRMLELAVNKNSRSEFAEQEWREFVSCLQEFLDVEHNVETLKISLGSWMDVSELVKMHNRKCIDRGYVDRKKAAV